MLFTKFANGYLEKITSSFVWKKNLGSLIFSVILEQIYSRTPNPGPEFIEKYKTYLANFGYDPSEIKDTPQDCDVSSSQLAQMMSMPGMNEALTNQFPDLKLNKSVQFNPLTSVFDTFKKLLELYFK